MSIAALGTVTVAITVLGATLLAAGRVKALADAQPARFNEINVFLHTSVDRRDALKLADALRQLPQVSGVRLLKREDAWARIQRREPSLAQNVAGNPLPDALAISAVEPGELPALAGKLRNTALYPQIANVTDASSEVRAMLGFSRVIRVMGSLAAIGLFIATLFIVYNTIRLTLIARQKEIKIMQLVGATAGFIRLPMVLEGVLYGFTGGLIASVILLLASLEVGRFLSSLKSPLLDSGAAGLTGSQITLFLVVLGASIGAIGSHLAIRRFLRVL
ncbi:MAG: ABC transporter permease [Armatimonadetes bacterium]|nr:ABC transporter permease [Armatimonadota bacterium]MDE2207088.1 ABC transporter permease [Armatimonadota bacterium]